MDFFFLFSSGLGAECANVCRRVRRILLAQMESQESDPPAAPMTEEEKLNELRKTVEIKQRENTIIIQGKRILFKILENGNIVGACAAPCSLFSFVFVCVCIFRACMYECMYVFFSAFVHVCL